MGIFGIVLTILCAWIFLESLGMISWRDDKKEIAVLLLAFLIGVGSIIYDAKSPIKETVTVIETTNPEIYNVKVHNPENKLITLRKTEKDPTRFGAVLYEKTIYQLELEGEK